MHNLLARRVTPKFEMLSADRRRIEIFVSMVFSVLMMAVPWRWIAGRGFVDRDVYLERFTYLQSVVEEQDLSTLLSFYTNEVLWDSAIRQASSLFGLPVEAVLGVVTFFCLFSFSRFTVRSGGFLPIFFLINPLVIDFAFSQLRLALSISLILNSFFLRRKAFSYFLITAACFVHSATLLFFLMYLVAVWIHRRLWRGKISVTFANFALMGCGLLLALVIGPFREALLLSIGDRRAEYTLDASTLSYASFWILMLSLVPFQGRRLHKDVLNMVAIICVATFVSATCLGVFGLRFLSALFPLIIVALLRFGRPAREAIILGFILYTVIQWYFWIR